MDNKVILSWELYFINLAYLTSLRSKDPVTKVGCIIVNPKNRIVSLGYNGFPDGIKDSQLPWDKNSKDLVETKYPYVIHAEENCILHSNIIDLTGCTLYTTHYPCHKCARAIIQKGIRTVIYIYNKNDKATDIMFKLVNMNVRQTNITSKKHFEYNQQQNQYPKVLFYFCFLQFLYICYLGI